MTRFISVKKAQDEAWKIYDSWRKAGGINCPAFKCKVRISLLGWRHLIGASGHKKRISDDVYRRLKLLTYIKKIIENSKEIEKILITAAKKSGNTPLEVTIHKFSPQGITGVVLLAESHIALHSWSEFNYLAIDIFTCGDKAKPEKALEYLKKKFKPKKVVIQKITRGIIK